MSTNNELDNQDKLGSQQVIMIPYSDSVLAEVGIAPSELKSIKPHWKRTQYRAIVNWLTKYQPPSSGSNLEMVRGYLETCYHFFQLEDWEKADRVLMIRVAGLTDEDLDDALGTWGAYSEQINLYQKLLGKLNHTRNISLLNGLGNACDTIGQFQTAID